ncbi:MAG: ATP-binding cassette domain-containing protein [Spirochaetaceae bacterium]|nr:MAG: ATP-binding cassette domain-containing protein [Spirochaetaceae bacterium]
MNSTEASTTGIQPCVRLRNISVQFEDFEALKDVSVEFPLGKTTLIMGPSGCGKSTLLKVAAGLLPPDRGEVEIAGVDALRGRPRAMSEMRKNTGFVFQDAGLWQNMTLFDNMALPLEFHYPDRAESVVRREIYAWANRFDLSLILPLRPSTLSGGERKLISFCRAMILNPNLLFLDEPTTFVDRLGVERMLSVLREKKASGCSMIGVTHDADLTSQLADYILVMKAGELREFGTTSEVARSRDPVVREILADVLDEAATYDGDILDLLEPNGDLF